MGVSGETNLHATDTPGVSIHPWSQKDCVHNTKIRGSSGYGTYTGNPMGNWVLTVLTSPLANHSHLPNLSPSSSRGALIDHISHTRFGSFNGLQSFREGKLEFSPWPKSPFTVPRLLPGRGRFSPPLRPCLAPCHLREPAQGPRRARAAPNVFPHAILVQALTHKLLKSG